MGCQAEADYYVAVRSREELIQALSYGRSQGLKVNIIGGGSNLVFPAKLSGLLIHIQNQGKTFSGSSDTGSRAATSELTRVIVQAGENWHEFVNWTLQQGLRGLENLSLIPGSVGAAPIQNIGAYGVEVESCVESVRAIHKATFEEQVFVREQCQFGYRDSIFKHAARDCIIWEVTFRFSRSTALHTDYAELHKAWEQQGCPDDPVQLSKIVCSLRQKKLPDPRLMPNAGSFFKNPLVSIQFAQQLQKQFPGLVSYPQADGRYKLAAGWLIQHAGWKGFEDRGVGVCATQALVLINPGRKPGHEVLALASTIQDSVFKKFAVSLEIEPVLL
jgi:UDP-N-acetylmuramate dehydrogenase